LIKHLPQNEIDKSKWDACLINSANGMIYGTSWYLDQLSPGWEALVYGEYEAVMPLPAKQKWGIHYLIRPAFCQQLGVFSKSAVDKDIIDEFIDAIPSRFRWINMPLNAGNLMEKPDLAKDWGVNYLLSLNSTYDVIRSSYVQNTKRNLGKAIEKEIVPLYSEDVKSFLDLKLKYAIANLNQTHIQFLTNIFNRYKISGEAKILCVVGDVNKMLAGALFIHFRNRWIYLLSTSSAQGKENRSMFAIIDKFIFDHAGKDEFLDFEGSMVPDLARFFAGFGASPEYFPHLKLNRLPFPLNLLKK